MLDSTSAYTSDNGTSDIAMSGITTHVFDSNVILIPRGIDFTSSPIPPALPWRDAGVGFVQFLPRRPTRNTLVQIGGRTCLPDI